LGCQAATESDGSPVDTVPTRFPSDSIPLKSPATAAGASPKVAELSGPAEEVKDVDTLYNLVREKRTSSGQRKMVVERETGQREIIVSEDKIVETSVVAHFPSSLFALICNNLQF
jgi:hypothetical protein